MKQTLLERLLTYFKITHEEYLELTKDVSFDDVPNYLSFPHILEARDLVLSYLKEGKKIMIYGDYDADGIMATSILVKTFQKFNYLPGYYIPSRYLDGYGINMQKAQQIIDKGYDLVITVDNGISANDPIKLLKDNGIKVIVLDHHERAEELPDADYIFHPTISGFGDIATSGAFVTYIFATALLDRHDKYLSILASISLITDMMPLVGYNRNFLRVVFKQFKKNEFLPITYLLDGQDFDENTIGMSIGPKINAIGRIIKSTSINQIVKFFVSENESEILSYYEWINNTNESRKLITKEAQIKTIGVLKDEQSTHSICLTLDVLEGVIGLVANNILSQLNCPCIIFTKSENEPGILKGSARAKEGFSIIDAFNYIKDYTLTHGGHKLAGGLSIKESDFETVKNMFEEYCKNNPPVSVEKEYIDIYLNEINKENYDLIRSFSPFGEQNKSPLFLLKHIKTSELTYSKNGEHIITQFGLNQKITGFNVDRNLLNESKYVDFIGRIRINEYRGSRNVEFLISSIMESKN